MLLRRFVAFTPLVGAILFPLVVPFSMSYLGIGVGITIALLLSIFWFIAMLRTSEMPH